MLGDPVADTGKKIQWESHYSRDALFPPAHTHTHTHSSTVEILMYLSVLMPKILIITIEISFETSAA